MARLVGGGMLAKCCNPECEAPFDYGQGRLIRFSRKAVDAKSYEKRALIQHFWLCEKCAGLYVFECESGMSVTIKLRHRELSEENRSYFISTA